MKQDVETSKFYQVGVVHGSIGKCGDPRFAGIYARLDEASNLQFVRDSMSEPEYKICVNCLDNTYCAFRISQ